MKNKIKTTDNYEKVVILTEKELSKKILWDMSCGMTITCMGIGFLLFLEGIEYLRVLLAFLAVFGWVLMVINR